MLKKKFKKKLVFNLLDLFSVYLHFVIENVILKHKKTDSKRVFSLLYFSYITLCMLRTYKNDIYNLIYRKLIIFIHFMMSK